MNDLERHEAIVACYSKEAINRYPTPLHGLRGNIVEIQSREREEMGGARYQSESLDA